MGSYQLAIVVGSRRVLLEWFKVIFDVSSWLFLRFDSYFPIFLLGLDFGVLKRNFIEHRGSELVRSLVVSISGYRAIDETIIS